MNLKFKKGVLYDLSSKKDVHREGTEVGIFDYPNFSSTGNIRGMKKVYGESAMRVKCDGFIYNVPKEIYDKAY